MREIKTHKFDPTNAAIKVTASENAYLVEFPDGTGLVDIQSIVLQFQNGSVTLNGHNGLTIEILLAIAADRIDQFNQGGFRCKENSCAITHIEEALHWLNARMHARMQRGVQGTLTP